MLKLFVRNIKKGFATNSSSYHSTTIHYIDIPKEVWIEFKEQGEQVEHDESRGYIRQNGVALLCDEGYMWRSFSEIEDAETWSVDENYDGTVRITVETTEDYREDLKYIG